MLCRALAVAGMRCRRAPPCLRHCMASLHGGSCCQALPGAVSVSSTAAVSAAGWSEDGMLLTFCSMVCTSTEKRLESASAAEEVRQPFCGESRQACTASRMAGVAPSVSIRHQSCMHMKRHKCCCTIASATALPARVMIGPCARRSRSK